MIFVGHWASVYKLAQGLSNDNNDNNNNIIDGQDIMIYNWLVTAMLLQWRLTVSGNNDTKKIILT